MKFWKTSVMLDGMVDVVNLANTEEEANQKTVDHLTSIGLDRDNFTLINTELDVEVVKVDG